MSNLHPSVRREYGGGNVRIDIEIASLVDEIWAAGIDLRGSCQDYFDYCQRKGDVDRHFWLLFQGATSVERFFQIVRPRRSDGDIWNRAFQYSNGATKPTNHWRFSLYSFNHCLPGPANDFPDDVTLESRILIPWTDYAFVLDRMVKHNGVGAEVQ
jgi:hypothetical protein